MGLKYFLSHHVLLKSCYEYIKHSRSIKQGCHSCIQGDNNINTRSKFQAYQTEVLEDHRLNIKGIKQSHIISATDYVIDIMEAKIPINLTKDNDFFILNK